MRCKDCVHYELCTSKVVMYNRCITNNHNDDMDMQCPYFLKINKGSWEVSDKSDKCNDEYMHHCCSECKELAPFEYSEEPLYDENLEGEMEYICDITVDVKEHLTKYCSACGAELMS